MAVIPNPANPLMRPGSDEPPPTPLTKSGRLTPDIDLQTRIIIIEDEMMIAWMLESMLEDMGFTAISIASDSMAAAQIADQARPGLIISDINLGAGLDGITGAVAMIARHGDLIPVIFVSAYADTETRAKVRQELPNAQLLRKPIQAEAIQEGVLRALRPRNGSH